MTRFRSKILKWTKMKCQRKLLKSLMMRQVFQILSVFFFAFIAYFTVVRYAVFKNINK